jgi:transcriptional regulator with XRE-family HTH domain
VSRSIAARARELRLRLGWSRAALAARSGVTVASIKRFESTGRIALERLLKLALVMDARAGWADLFRVGPLTGMTLRDLEKMNRPLRKRGRTEKP